MKLTENQKEAIAAIERSLISFKIAYEQLKNEGDEVDIDKILEQEFCYLSNKEDTCCDASVLKEELFEVLVSVKELNYDED